MEWILSIEIGLGWVQNTILNLVGILPITRPHITSEVIGGIMYYHNTSDLLYQVHI